MTAALRHLDAPRRSLLAGALVASISCLTAGTFALAGAVHRSPSNLRRGLGTDNSSASWSGFVPASWCSSVSAMRPRPISRRTALLPIASAHRPRRTVVERRICRSRRATSRRRPVDPSPATINTRVRWLRSAIRAICPRRCSPRSPSRPRRMRVPTPATPACSAGEPPRPAWRSNPGRPSCAKRRRACRSSTR